jgi:hypothetical protein
MALDQCLSIHGRRPMLARLQALLVDAQEIGSRPSMSSTQDQASDAASGRRAMPACLPNLHLFAVHFSFGQAASDGRRGQNMISAFCP